MKSFVSEKNNIATKQIVFNPFPGLRPFTMDESHVFFGREGQSEEVLNNLAANRFVAVVGASGSGKSSLMYCGLVPVLHGGFINQAKSKWRIVPTRPSTAPIKNMAIALVNSHIQTKSDTPNGHINASMVDAVLRGSSMGLLEATRMVQLGDDENMLLIIDQFEELFRFQQLYTDGQGKNEALAFVKLILEAVRQTRKSIYVVLTMRSDFIGECAQYQQLTELINESHYLIPQMSREDLRVAIEGPVAVGGGSISKHLLNQLLNDVGDNPDQLPILQHALMRTWNYWMENREGDEPMDVTHYIAIGKMDKALSDHANEAFSELSPEDERICENMFKTITEMGSDNRGVRRPSRVSEIAGVADCSVNEVAAVVEIFRQSGRSFLSTVGSTAITADTIIDISHESLMRIWDRLKVWVDEESASAQMYLKIAQSAAKYQNTETGLIRPPDLHLAVNWRNKQKPTTAWALRYSPDVERTLDYLDLSEKEYRAEEMNKIRQQKRALRRSRIFALVLGIAAILSLAFMLYAFVAQIESEKQRQIAIDKQKLADSSATAARQAQIFAEKQTEFAENQRLLAEQEREKAEEQRQNAIRSAEEANNQRKIADDKTEEAETQRKLADSSANIANYEKERALAAQDEALRMRKLSIAQSMAVKSQQIDQDTTLRALIAYQAYKFFKNNQKEEDKQKRLHNNDIYTALYFTDKLLSPTKYLQTEAHKDAIRAIAFHKDKQKLYTTGSDGNILKWNLQNSDSSFSSIYKNKVVNRGLAVNRTGKWLAVGSESPQIMIFNLDNSDNKPFTLSTGSRINWELLFANNSDDLYVAGTDSSLVKWDIANKRSVTIANINSKIRALDISSDDRLMAIGTDNGHLILWDLANNRQDTLLWSQTNNAVLALAFNSTNNLLAVGDLYGNLRIWDLQQKKLLNRLSGHRARIMDIEFSPDQSILATASFDAKILLWNVNDFDEQPIVLQDDNSWVWSIAFDSTGDKLITGFTDSKLQFWPINIDKLAKGICQKLSRDMTESEWKRYVAKDLPSEKVCE